MNYSESKQILGEVKKADKILVNCHRSPDADSVASAMAMRRVLMDLGKRVEVICPDALVDNIRFIASSEVVRKVDFDTFDFGSYDLFVILDASEWRQVAGYGYEKVPKIKKIVIDHHFTNEGFGDINLVDLERSSTGEILYALFEDWNVEITSELAENLLTGIIFDSGSLQHPNANTRTAKAYARLMELGADKNKIILNLYKNIKFDQARLMGEILKNLQIDRKNRFVWSAVPYEVQSKYAHSLGVKSMAATLYASAIDETDFGLIMIEEKKNYLNISLRAKKGFDISRIAVALGGGGHKESGAVIIQEMPFEKAVEKALGAVRKYGKQN